MSFLNNAKTLFVKSAHNDLTFQRAYRQSAPGAEMQRRYRDPFGRKSDYEKNDNCWYNCARGAARQHLR